VEQGVCPIAVVCAVVEIIIKPQMYWVTILTF